MKMSDTNGAVETSVANPISVRVPDACKLTGIKRSKLYQLIANGEIEVVKVGRATLIPVESLRQFIEARRHA